MSDVFPKVCELEHVALHIRGLIHALDLIVTEALDGPEALAAQCVTAACLKHVQTLDETYSALFRLTHYDRERFEREGWPANQTSAEDGAEGAS